MPDYSEVKDSGARQQFDTGSVRDTPLGKGRYDLLSPLALRRLAVHSENGAAKYGARNWEKGQPLSRYIDSALRHLFKHLEGHRDEDHLAAAAWNVQGAIHTEECVERGLLPAALSDLPDYTVEEPPHVDLVERLPDHIKESPPKKAALRVPLGGLEADVPRDPHTTRVGWDGAYLAPPTVWNNGGLP